MQFIQIPGPVKRQVNRATSAELTHIKCYRGWEVDEGSADTLTPIRGYPNSEHESVRQTRGPGPHSRPLSARRSAAQDAHPRRVLRHVRVSSQSRAAAFEPAAERPWPAWIDLHAHLLHMAPRHAFPRLGRIAGDHSIHIEVVLIGFHFEMRAPPHHVSDRDKELDQNRHWVRFRVGFQLPNILP